MSEGFSFAYLKEMFVITLLTIARVGDGDEVAQEEEGEELKLETPATTETLKSEDGRTSDTDAPVVVELADGSAAKEHETFITEKNGGGKEKEPGNTTTCPCCT